MKIETDIFQIRRRFPRVETRRQIVWTFKLKPIILGLLIQLLLNRSLIPNLSLDTSSVYARIAGYKSDSP